MALVIAVLRFMSLEPEPLDLFETNDSLSILISFQIKLNYTCEPDLKMGLEG